MNINWNKLTGALKDIFTYDPENALLFSSGVFWFLFAGVLLIYHFLRSDKIHIRLRQTDLAYSLSLRNLFLLAFSIFFYYKSSGFYFFLLIVSTVVDYFLGRAIYNTPNKSTKKGYIVLSLFSNLGMLAYYKYTGFFVDTINHWFGTSWIARDYLSDLANTIAGTDFTADSIFLPVGISFYTFQTISYSIDIYRGHVKPVRNILDFAFYVSFFPQLVAGPIVRASEFIPQIYKKFKLTAAQYNRAIYLIIGGLIKKILISDYISVNFVDRIFDNPSTYSGFENLMGVYGYTIQIYCDFSAYSDIAIGIALLMGFQLPLNFNSPYKAASITDFWRRWHISLSSWLRDYLYIPLGGNRYNPKSNLNRVMRWLLLGPLFYDRMNETARHKLSTNMNLFVTMLLGGLWHGAHIKFILWGALHGVALAMHKWWGSIQLLRSERPLKDTLSFTSLIVFYHLLYGVIYFITPEALDSLVIVYVIFLFHFALIGLLEGFDILAVSLLEWPRRTISRFGYWLLTFHFVVFCWIFFRAKDMATVRDVLHQLYFSFKGEIATTIVPHLFLFGLLALSLLIFISFTRLLSTLKPTFSGWISHFQLFGLPIILFSFISPVWSEALSGYNLIFFLILLGFILHWIPQSIKNQGEEWLGHIPDIVKALLIAIVILILYQMRIAGSQPFIYFQF